jgi:hypothetical protein
MALRYKNLKYDMTHNSRIFQKLGQTRPDRSLPQSTKQTVATTPVARLSTIAYYTVSIVMLRILKIIKKWRDAAIHEKWELKSKPRGRQKIQNWLSTTANSTVWNNKYKTG